MFNAFYPDEDFESSYDIPYKEYFNRGYRSIIFDIDNTLVPHGAPANARSIALFDKLKQIGFDILLLSNNKQERVDMFNASVQVHTIHKAGKPLTKNYLRAMEILHTDRDSTLFIGDQLFTDIYGAKRAGIHTILVKPLDPHEEIQIVLKRVLERIVLFFYHRKKDGQLSND